MFFLPPFFMIYPAIYTCSYLNFLDRKIMSLKEKKGPRPLFFLLKELVCRISLLTFLKII